MQKRIVRALILLVIALAAALGVASAAGAIGIGHGGEQVTTSNDSVTWGLGASSVGSLS